MVEVPIAEITTRRVISVPPTMPTAEVARLIRDRRITGLPVVDAQGGVVGIVSEIDLATRPGATAGAIMSRQVVAVTPETTVREVAAFLRVGVRTLYHAIRRGEFPAVRIGRRILIVKSMLAAFLDVEAAVERAMKTRVAARRTAVRNGGGAVAYWAAMAPPWSRSARRR